MQCYIMRTACLNICPVAQIVIGCHIVALTQAAIGWTVLHCGRPMYPITDTRLLERINCIVSLYLDNKDIRTQEHICFQSGPRLLFQPFLIGVCYQSVVFSPPQVFHGLVKYRTDQHLVQFDLVCRCCALTASCTIVSPGL